MQPDGNDNGVSSLCTWPCPAIRKRARVSDPTSVPLLLIDSSAARAILQRDGVGRVRHLDVKLLWTQDRVASGMLEVHPAPTRSYVSDIGCYGPGIVNTIAM